MKGTTLLAATAIVAASSGVQAQVDTDHPVRQFNFRQTSHDECVMQSGIVTFDAAGYGQITLSTMTLHSGDIWKARVLLRDAAGKVIYTTPMLNSPKMENKDNHPPTYNWSYSFRVDPGVLSAATGAEMSEIRC